MKTVTFGISSEAPGGSAAPFATEAREECCHCLQLQSRIKDLQMQVIQLRRQIEYWTKRFHGRMSEKRHLPLDPAQLLLPFPAEEPGQQPCGAAEGEHTGNRNRPMWQKPRQASSGAPQTRHNSPGGG